jgi:hypothetical protein
MNNTPSAAEKQAAHDLQRPSNSQSGAKTFKVGERLLHEIIADLSKPLKAEHLKQKQVGKGQGSRSVPYLPWHTAIKYLDYFAPGWCYEIRSITHVGANCAVVVRISIPTADGIVYREATGLEEDEVDSWGDPTSNAESMALRRAAAKFGLGLYLYNR